MTSSRTVDWILDKKKRNVPYAGFVCDTCGYEDKTELPEGTTGQEADDKAAEMMREHFEGHRLQRENR